MFIILCCTFRLSFIENFGHLWIGFWLVWLGKCYKESISIIFYFYKYLNVNFPYNLPLRCIRTKLIILLLNY